ncbi:aminopeptidase N [Sphingomonas montanisoli]|uniref:Aminopeptidase N n=1 Tax=Sphingomonas montanisoli TaxID=2606412 RepID=A0A5D9C3V1_9SPHN|nr:aminopeptidase N [Sphingomonas montanisoli]TZG26424.1 aminopeptidase N [Sphingomonas montanisoli]
MLDAQSATAAPPIIRREEYRAPDWLVPEVELDFALDPAATRIKARFHVTRNGAHHRPLRLDGDGLTALSVTIDGAADDDAWRMAGDDLLIDLSGESHLIETEVEISPQANTQLMGLYASTGMLCTQCEPEGFRRITFFPDRPDILSRYTVRLEADKARFPVLLSNGDLVGSGDLDGGRHFARWVDPFPKPTYLFALVAADLKANVDQFATMSGRNVKLAIWVAEADLPKTGHAMAALKASMAWDEKVYGREYDLGEFNIVAVADFNFGAMENKSLNIFNSRYVLADPETATDADFDAVAGVVAHEYFHNWSGNRVTCRDWFQLSLKEGFTVFRDQAFSADQGSPAVKRIEDVRGLRAAQFPEDAGPLAHPIRPESYIEISNFYTATVYNKGAEIIRMLHTMLGPQRFRAGTDLYFTRHDGTAATCEDFVLAMEEASGVDLSRFRLWYSQAGTPRVKATLTHEAASGRAHLTLEQSVPATPGQPDKQPMPIPLRLDLFGEKTQRSFGGERLVMLDDDRLDVTFEGIGERPVLSINRGFSAPVIIETDRSAADLAFLSAHDDDPFARYEAMQQLMLDTLVGSVANGKADHGPVIEAVQRTLTDPMLDSAFIGEAVLLPSEGFIGDQMLVVDPQAIHQAREALRRDLGTTLSDAWRDAYDRSRANRFEQTPQAKGARRLRNVSLGFMMAGKATDVPGIAKDQFDAADNMTDRQGALGILSNVYAPERDAAFSDFYARYRDNGLVLDKWFTTQALSVRPDTIDQVIDLADHPDFTLNNPNRLRSLVGALSANQLVFHDPSGRGYRFLADMVLAVDKLNPQTAAKLVPPLGRWRRFGETAQTAMRAELERIVSTPGLSKDVFEQVSKSLV